MSSIIEFLSKHGAGMSYGSLEMMHARERAAIEDARYLAEHGDSDWKIDNSSWQDYARDVYFPSLKLSLDEIVADLESPSSVGLDIAGGTNGKAMIDLLHRGILSSAAYTSLEDRRSPDTLREPNLHLITGNLLLDKTWSDILRWRSDAAPEGLKLITHEPRDTLQWEHPDLYIMAAHTLLKNTAPDGALVSQIPESLRGRELARVCREIARLPGVIETAVSDQQGRYPQVLAKKAA
jgi:hypothetical protein